MFRPCWRRCRCSPVTPSTLWWKTSAMTRPEQRSNVKDWPSWSDCSYTAFISEVDAKTHFLIRVVSTATDPYQWLDPNETLCISPLSVFVRPCLFMWPIKATKSFFCTKSKRSNFFAVSPALGSQIGITFSCPGQLNWWPCHSLTHSLTQWVRFWFQRTSRH